MLILVVSSTFLYSKIFYWHNIVLACRFRNAEYTLTNSACV